MVISHVPTVQENANSDANRDQELRFTVHESPDYFKLKMSVFNDDKKTEMIGESWIDLDTIIAPGGGQHDLWQNLNCKGRYAGEIRIELTYYDTRPREATQESRTPSTRSKEVSENSGDRLSGPRQPRPPKRRPLPSEPTAAAPSLNEPQGPSYTHHDMQARHSSSDASRRSRRHMETPLDEPDNGYYQPTSHQHEIDTPDHLSNRNRDNHNGYSQWQDPYATNDTEAPYDPRTRAQQSSLSQSPSGLSSFDHAYNHHVSEVDFQHAPIDDSGSNLSRFHDDNIDPRLYHEPLRDHSATSQIPSRYDIDDSHVVSPVSKNNSYDHTLARRHTTDSWNDGYVSPIHDDEEPPPPPPAHGRRDRQHSPQRSSGWDEMTQDIAAPADSRGSRDGVAKGSSQPGQVGSPYHSFTSSRSQPLISARPSKVVDRSPNHQSHFSQPGSPIKDYGGVLPSSLVPGYENKPAVESTERPSQEQSRNRQRYQWQPQDTRREMPSEQQTSHFAQQPEIQRLAHERRAHRNSAPVVMKPITMTPDPQRPLRKSVSPQPKLHTPQPQRTGVPFSPDFFDAFNPSLSQSSSVNDPGARYETPAGAKEATRQAERQAALGDGPIIGSDGRIIDPSDHLPTDTWAPEPEAKPPRKGPEVTLKFRHSPQGAQAMPPSGVRRPLAETRPNASPPRLQQHMSADSSPAPTQRARLQKKFGGASPQHYQHNSSPAVPTMNSSPLARGPFPRAAASDYPSYGASPNENARYGSSPQAAYTPTHRSGAPPPVPGKIPLDGRFDDNGTDVSALSDEMSRINIDAGGRPRRARYGTRDV